MEGPVVATSKGKVRGLVDRSILGDEYLSFKGIPFAKPPVGQLRFQDPEPAEPWTGVRDATQHGGICGQFDMVGGTIMGGDDCLYVNVYTRSPLKSGDAPLQRRPVLVWIHGGGFVNGSGDDKMYAPDYFMRKDVVLASLNYRVGVLGFLDLEDEVAPGNQGLKDQVMALEWVRDNIANFGGDPGNVTIFGESAGGASIHYLCLSPLAKGLFHKAISQSGVVLNTWARTYNPKELAYRFCESLGKKTRNSGEIVDFLRTIEVPRLIEAQEKLLTKVEKMQFRFPFGPGMDVKSKRPFMPIPIEEAAEQGIHLPLIIGHTHNEGIALLKFIAEDLTPFNEDFAKVLHPFAAQLMRDEYNLTADELKRLYCKLDEITKERIEGLSELSGDIHFVEGIHRVVKTQVEKSSAPTYMYRFSYDRAPSAIKAFFGCAHMKGATHADELPYLFRPKMFEAMDDSEPMKKGTEPFKIMEQLTDLWINFATTGRPTPTETVPLYWQPVNSGTVLRYLNIDEDIAMEAGLNLEQRYNSYKITRNKL